MATDYKAKFQKARGARKAEPRGRGVIEIQSIDVAAGTLTGKIIDGIGAGETLTWVPGGKLDMDDYTKKSKTKLDAPRRHRPRREHGACTRFEIRALQRQRQVGVPGPRP